MSKSKCNEIMDEFLLLDKNQKLPLKITLHLLACKECRTQVRLCSLAEKASSKPLNAKLPLDNDALVSIMSKIDKNYSEKTGKIRHVSLANWIISGVVMLVLMMFYGLQTGSLNSTVMVVPFYLCFAGIVCVYCALFVGSNLDFFVKLFDTEPKNKFANT